MKTGLQFFLAIILLLACAGCADTSTANKTDNRSATTIPWNRPEKWEGTGALGGMMNATGSGGGQ